jgi:SAM-dependent methyltransferase
MNTFGKRRFKAISALLPRMPDETLQLHYTGNKEDATLNEGFAAYRLFKGSYEKYVGSIGSCRGILDFGCGWGRTIRFFLKDVSPERLWGIDHSPEVIHACLDTNKWCKFELIEPTPPTPFPAESFDLIYLYSVFSHLPEAMHWEWLKEFQRLLVPGGLMVATTRRRDFIEWCASLREDPNLQDKPGWIKGSAKAFLDANAALAAYDSGSFCYSNLGDDRWSFWGEACIPRGYVERRWPELFDVLEYIDLCPQNAIVARKSYNPR